MNASCPIPIRDYTHVTMAHGGGGRLMHELIDKMFASVFSVGSADHRHDGAVVDLPQGRVVVTTDSFVVRPLFFPGSDIGKLAVYGTVNDLAMCGARPLVLTAGFIIEEGLEMETLWRVVLSMKEAAGVAGVRIVTGDTKVVDRGKGDGLYINTSGIGVFRCTNDIGPASVRAGDAVILNGDVGRHGMAVMAVREGLQFDCTIESDCQSLAEAVNAVIDSGVDVHCMRDCTRGGLASVLVEIAQARGLGIRVDERKIAVRDDVRAACEILGFDPLYVANEGRFVLFVPESSVDPALRALRDSSAGRDAVVIGHVTTDSTALVTLTTSIGSTRILDMLSGEQLPRIC
jgi:hydrogenase expression/formation protein HypE